MTNILKLTGRLFFLSLFLSGCATKITGIHENYQEITVSLDSSNNGRYFLYSNGSRQIDSAIVSGGQLKFSKFQMVSSKTCLSIRDDNGKLVEFDSEYSNSFQVFLPEIYSAALNEYRKESSRQRTEVSDIASLKNLIANATNQLPYNRAFISGSCSLPSQRALPKKPATRCTSRNTCMADANQICFAMAFGSEYCSVALSKERVPGVVAGPACGAVAAQLAKEKYEMSDAVLDAIRGAVDDFADGLLKDDGFWSKLAGVFVKGLNYTSKLSSATTCAQEFVSRHYGPYEAWLSRVEDIRNEPQQSLSKCRDLIAERKNNTNRKIILEQDYAASQDTLRIRAEKVSIIMQKVSTVKSGC